MNFLEQLTILDLLAFSVLPAKTSKLSTTGTGHLSGYPKT